MNRWQEYLHRRHSEAELAEWAKRLRHFRFCRAIGGHANDGDELVLALAYSSSADFGGLMRDLGATSLDATNVHIGEITVNILVLSDRVLLSLSGADGDPFEVTLTDVANAERVESALPPVVARTIDPPIDGPRCISPKHYPQFWSD